MTECLDPPCAFCGYNGAGYWQRDTHDIDCPWRCVGGARERELALRRVLSVNLDACAEPTMEQQAEMETGFGAVMTSRMALELGMKTAIGNVKRRRQSS